ncbi:N-acetylmuramoyl-L-alanine amidase [Acrocarpospora phusangensis]|uniref:N-acetylmuramoyl-L-alanine amidase n=1 Tax=Acrocarpospora phusangensis TaxID=1070424 RepID=A0A919QCA9_9ACTN|nr:peptidoglycan-binding domain-containing protein [Acrocarpospora phusangensis]GIH26048.1 N-acetylmuramoyl-L-alanine amidase [Acrocarpospora phusangensis]
MSIDLVTRKAWGARAPRGAYSRLTSTRGVKVHYTGGRIDPRMLDDHSRCVAAVQAIQDHHQFGNGWIDTGYSALTCWHRKVFVARGPHVVPAANGAGLNSGHYAVCALAGNSGLVEPTDDLLLGILDAIEWLRAEGGAGREVKGHRDGYSTDCPGKPLYAWVKAGAPRPGIVPPPASPPSNAPSWPGRLLEFPPITRGSDVMQWQRQMRDAHGFELAADGAYGQRSRDVCKTFQRRADLDDDGIVGRLTWRAAFADQDET